MGRISIKQTINVYEVNGEETSMKEEELLLGVDSHNNDDSFVVLKFSSGDTVTVMGDDLIAATKNAMNTGD